MGNNLDKWVTESHIVLAVHYIYSTLLCAIPLNIRLLSESKVFTINTKSYALYYSVFPFQTLCNSVYKRLYLWRAININIQSHLIVLAGPFEFLQLLLFEFRFYILFVHFSFDISHDNTAIQRTHTPTHIHMYSHDKRDKSRKRQTKKKTSSFDCCWCCCCCIVPFDFLCLPSSVIVFVSFDVVVTHSISSPVCVCIQTKCRATVVYLCITQSAWSD